jgi:cellulose synthase operon protein YhjQ
MCNSSAMRRCRGELQVTIPDPNPMPPKTLADQGDISTPEDVATLYSWANLHGAKYRDFSASRALARERARLRAEEAVAEEKRQQEEDAERRRLEEAQISARLAAEAAEAARQAEAERLADIASQAEAEREAALAAQQAQRQAPQQPAWQPSHLEPVPAAPALPPSNPIQNSFPSPFPSPFPDYPASQHALPQYPSELFASPPSEQYSGSPWHAADLRETREPIWRPASLAREVPVVPAPHPPSNQFPANRTHSAGPAEDTLAGSCDRIANRWYALKSVFDPQAAPIERASAQPPSGVPVLAVFSLAGGVGKTSLVASLGRALSSRGERVLLVDTAAYGLLPFFFGARDQRPGMLRTFNPPGVSADAPIQLITLDPEGQPPEHGGDPSQAANQDWLAQEVDRYTRSANRVLIDLPTASGSTTRRLLRLSPVVLVPVLPDMNSVVSVGAIEAFFQRNGNTTGVASARGAMQIMPYYVLNQFDDSSPLHLDVREILREQIGDRLLPFALRRSPAVSEALAEGMTVMDYAPGAVAAEDYANLARWVRGLSSPATQSYRGVRWSER